MDFNCPPVFKQQMLGSSMNCPTMDERNSRWMSMHRVNNFVQQMFTFFYPTPSPAEKRSLRTFEPGAGASHCLANTLRRLLSLLGQLSSFLPHTTNQTLLPPRPPLLLLLWLQVEGRLRSLRRQVAGHEPHHHVLAAEIVSDHPYRWFLWG